MKFEEYQLFQSLERNDLNPVVESTTDQDCPLSEFQALETPDTLLFVVGLISNILVDHSVGVLFVARREINSLHQRWVVADSQFEISCILGQLSHREGQNMFYFDVLNQLLCWEKFSDFNCFFAVDKFKDQFEHADCARLKTD